LEINGDSMVMDVALTPKMETKIHAKPGGKNSKRRQMGGAKITSSRTQNTSQNNTNVGLWKTAWNNEAARNVEQCSVA